MRGVRRMPEGRSAYVGGWMETIEILTVKEALAVKPLWSEIFFEDSKRFTDYYFAEKMAYNTGYGLQCDGVLCGMLFLTPYTGRILSPDQNGGIFQDIPLRYIVGVGTKKEYRHRGYMDRLLRRALSDLRKSGHPFTFLMPADPAIYAPYQFRYIYEKPYFKIGERERRRAQAMKRGEEQALADFAEKWLERRCQFFLRRDASYYERQKKESRAQNGDVYLWKKKNEIIGFYLYANEGEQEEIQEAMVADAFAEAGLLQISQQTRPVIMARIVNVFSMLSLMRLQAQAPWESMTVTVGVIDDLLTENCGTFLWTVGKKESTIALLEKTVKPEVCAEIGDLTEFLFGRMSCGECFAPSGGDHCGQHGDVYVRLSEIQVLPQVFVNEIV